MPRPSRTSSSWSIESVAVHAGEGAYQSEATSTTTPIFMASSFHYNSSDELERVLGHDTPGFVYNRYGNPTTHA
ncbi:MAG TPA: PLP-dependent transferase, partial [Rubrobacter sp.]|nr:PLP-dependent transferase [Rubrobacter sp.]